ncbi:AAA family ATPase [Caenimonas sp. SL110]|uniref:AAA family ATPase n=1 Tax=Caenimonas sp. SL110 TaxID=1450524 RepID=UPI000652B994|nr:AAA family ATPase [Caenimonas sp. SL110]
MKAILICASQGLLDELGRAVQAAGHQVAHAIVRKPGEALQTLVPDEAVDLLVIDSGRAPQGDLDFLARLTQARPALAVVMLSGNRDSDLLIAAMRAGVREVLPAQPAAAEFAAALSRLNQRKPDEPAGRRGRVVAFISCKGGSGATFVATNVAYMLAAEQGKSTALIDLNLQYGDACYFMTDRPGKSNLADLARQVDRLDARLLAASMTQVAPHFDLLAAPEEAEDALSITGAQIERVVDLAAHIYDFVVLDVERVLDAPSMKGLDHADTIYLVMENMIPFMRDARRLLRILRSLGYPDSKIRIVVNRYRKDGAIDLEQVEKVVGLPVSHVLPDSFTDVAQAVNTGVALTTLHPHGAVARGLREIAESLGGKHIARGPAGWVGRLLGE